MLQVNGYVVRTERSNRLVKHDRSAIDFVSLIADTIADHLRRHGAIEPVLFADAHGDRHDDALEALGEFFLRDFLAFDYTGALLHFLLDLAQRTLGSHVGKPTWHKEVAGKAIADRNGLAGSTELRNILAEYYFHLITLNNDR